MTALSDSMALAWEQGRNAGLWAGIRAHGGVPADTNPYGRRLRAHMTMASTEVTYEDTTEADVEVITDPDLVRAGDTVHMTYDGHAWSGIAWADPEAPDDIMLAGYSLTDWTHTRTRELAFVRAERPSA